MSDKILVRTCPELDCLKLHQTNDPTGQTPCDDCAAKKEAAKKAETLAAPPLPAPEPAPEPATETLEEPAPESEDDEV